MVTQSKLITMASLIVVLLVTDEARTCLSQEPEMAAALAPVQVRVDFWSPERPRSVTVAFYRASYSNGAWRRGDYITSIATVKNGQQNDQVIRGFRFMDGGQYWVQLNYTTSTGQSRVYCRVNRGKEAVWLHAGAPSTPLQP